LTWKRYMQTVRYRYTLKERKFQGTKVPSSESSIDFPRTGGAKRPASERAREPRFHGATWPVKRLGTSSFTCTRRIHRSLDFYSSNLQNPDSNPGLRTSKPENRVWK